jgi:hypothetical protein
MILTSLLLNAGRIWIFFIVLAIVNGVIRDKFLVPLLGRRLALPFSGISLSLMIFATTFVSLPIFDSHESSQYWLIGGVWLVMTILFEFLFGRFVMGDSWEKLLDAYKVNKGNLWLLVLLVIALSPYLAAKLRGLV